MFYHFLPPEGAHPTWEENFIEQNTKLQGPFFLSHTSKLNQQKQWDVVSKIAANIYPTDKYDIFPIILLLTNHETLYNLNIVLSLHAPFKPITALFTIKGLWPYVHWHCNE